MRGKRKQQRQRKSRVKRFFVIGLSVVVLLVAGVVVLIGQVLDEEYLAGQLEREISSEVTIGSVDLSWLAVPTKLTLKNVKLVGKDGDSRASDAEVSVDQVDLSVSLWGLFKKRIEVTNMTIRGARVTSTVYEDGGSSLEALFESPDEEKKQRRKKAKGGGKNVDSKVARKVGDEEDGEDEGGGFNVFDHDDFVAALGGFYLEDCSADLTIEKSGLRIRCTDWNLELAALEIDPKRLQDTDTAKMKMSVKVSLDSTKGWHYGDLNIDGGAVTRLFNPDSGEMEPDVEGEFGLGEDSWLNTRVPVISEAWGKLDKLKKIGIELAPLPEKATFGRSQAIAAHYHKGKVMVRKPLSLWVGDWEVAAMDGSWVQTETDQHEVKAELLASRQVSATVYGLITAAIDYLPGDIRDAVSKDMKTQLFKGERFMVRVKSSEDLSDPKIRLVDGIPDFGKAAEKAGKKLLREKGGGLLDSLLGK